MRISNRLAQSLIAGILGRIKRFCAISIGTGSISIVVSMNFAVNDIYGLILVAILVELIISLTWFNLFIFYTILSIYFHLWNTFYWSDLFKYLWHTFYLLCRYIYRLVKHLQIYFIALNNIFILFLVEHIDEIETWIYRIPCTACAFTKWN